jgi:hypothetical protein
MYIHHMVLEDQMTNTHLSRAPWESAFFAHVPSTWKDGQKPS